jgi:Tfp pilus assembly protein PilF
MRRALGIMVMVVAAGMLAGCGQKAPSATAANEQARQLLMQGVVMLKQGEVVNAVQNFATAIKTAPDYAEAYFMLAETFIRLKQFEQAKGVLNLAVAKFPDNPVTYYLFAMAYESAGELMPAIISARKSIDLYREKKDEGGEKRATILLGVLVQQAKTLSEAAATTPVEEKK